VADVMRQRANGIVPGMAHLAGGGPAGLVCGDCDHFEPDLYGGGLCRKAVEMTRRTQPLISSDNRACKYFDLDTQPKKPTTRG